MFAELVCVCGATLHLDIDDEMSGLLLVNRFVEAHVKCGFVTPLSGDTPEKSIRYDLQFKGHTLNEED